jgi:hypothetical protein
VLVKDMVSVRDGKVMKQDRDTLGEISQYSWVRGDGPSDDGDIRLELVKKVI